jgi:DNA modification methylase
LTPNTTEFGDCRAIMRQWATNGVKVQMCVTSPPYFGLRDYGVAGQLGAEKTPDEYVTAMVETFRAVRDVLADDGTLWLNLGDSYAGSWGNYGGHNRGKGNSQRPIINGSKAHQEAYEGLEHWRPPTSNKFEGIKNKDLIAIPWMVALALRTDGWYLRQDIIWAKPNPMPESVRDRCTKAHEYIFLLSKSPRYYFDPEAIAEPVAPSTIARMNQPTLDGQNGSERIPGKTNGNMKAVLKGRGGKTAFRGQGHMRDGDGPANRDGKEMKEVGVGDTRNRRSVWTVTTKPFKGAHFATFPPDLIEPCILAGSRPGDIVLDPFMGSGTTAGVALKHGRQYLGCELNPEYGLLHDSRIAKIWRPR